MPPPNVDELWLATAGYPNFPAFLRALKTMCLRERGWLIDLRDRCATIAMQCDELIDALYTLAADCVTAAAKDETIHAAVSDLGEKKGGVHGA